MISVIACWQLLFGNLVMLPRRVVALGSRLWRERETRRAEYTSEIECDNHMQFKWIGLPKYGGTCKSSYLFSIQELE